MKLTKTDLRAIYKACELLATPLEDHFSLWTSLQCGRICSTLTGQLKRPDLAFKIARFYGQHAWHTWKDLEANHNEGLLGAEYRQGLIDTRITLLLMFAQVNS